MTYSKRPRRLLGFGRSATSAVSAMNAVAIWSGLVSPAGGEDRGAVPPYDRRVLSEIARDVLRRGATGGNQSVPDATSPAAKAEEVIAVVGAAPDPDSPVTHNFSLDAAKSAGDPVLTGSRGVPALPAGGSHSGTVTVTIPAATVPNTYYLLACADAPNTVVEADETNNCKASSSTVTVTP